MFMSDTYIIRNKQWVHWVYNYYNSKNSFPEDLCLTFNIFFFKLEVYFAYLIILFQYLKAYSFVVNLNSSDTSNS